MKIEKCQLCGNDDMLLILRDNSIKILRCSICDYFLADHFENKNALPWSHYTLSQKFLTALQNRRDIQSKKILEKAPKSFLNSRLLDYGCGQGSFLSHALNQGIDAYGCDLDLTRIENESVLARCFQIKLPWELSKTVFPTVVLLDVLEHNSLPLPFLKKLNAFKVENVICKVPLSNGFFFRLSLLLCKLGYPNTIKNLFQVSDPFPHTVYFSKKSLTKCFDKAGYTLIRHHSLEEVGSDLPDRLRFVNLNPVISAAGRIVGFLIGKLTPVFPESGVFYFQKK